MSFSYLSWDICNPMGGSGLIPPAKKRLWTESLLDQRHLWVWASGLCLCKQKSLSINSWHGGSCPRIPQIPAPSKMLTLCDDSPLSFLSLRRPEQGIVWAHKAFLLEKRNALACRLWCSSALWSISFHSFCFSLSASVTMYTTPHFPVCD